MQIIALINQKGGLGKTICAIITNRDTSHFLK